MAKTTDQVLADARAASRLRDDEDLSRILVEMERDIMDALRLVKVGENKELETLHAKFAGIQGLRIKLQALIDDGDVAKQMAK